MPFNEEEVLGTQVLQQERRDKFASQTADRIRSSGRCLFSLLPHEELARLTGDWYEACSQGMLRGNFAPIETWVREQSHRAANQGFAPADLLGLLQICRQSVMALDGWNEDALAIVDEVIQEVFDRIRPNLVWDSLDDPEDGTASETLGESPESSATTSESECGERRKFARNRLRFPIRVVSSGTRGMQDITQTESISRRGLYFITCQDYQIEQILKVDFPYWNQPGGINKEYSAKVTRLVQLPENRLGVGIEFLEIPGRKDDR
jgi:hypothetical protein